MTHEADGPMLPELIRLQAARTPQRDAVTGSEKALAYQELISMAGRFAALLASHGAGPGATVGICMARRTELAAALLGCWQIGAAYCPVDPGCPPERAAWMLNDCQAAAVLTDATAEECISQMACPRLSVDAASWPAGSESSFSPVTGVDRAYVIYTSGSTGRPKAVMISHAGIRNRVLWTLRQHRLCESDRILQRSSMGFDAAAWEIFAPLVSGGATVMMPPHADGDMAALVRAVRTHQITVLQVVPSVLRLLVDEPQLRECTTLRLLLCAGEPLRAEDCQRLLASLDVEIWNTYGPSECSIDVTAGLFDPGQRTGPVSIGRPIDNTRIVLLEQDLTPVSGSLPGEICVGGTGVGQGYFGRPALTAERFVPDPSGPPGARLYRTGDLARWMHDASLEFLGRIDHQVKINGVRIEPGEIEAALTAHPEVQQAVVTAATGKRGNRRLIAYVVTVLDDAPRALREFLRQRLPQQMIPSVFITLPELPLLPNGKLDRASLPAPDPVEVGRPAYVAPRTALEREIAALWEELLEIEKAGADDDFFQLGGDSLLAARLAAAIRDSVSPDVTPQQLFTASTLGAQAELVEAGRASRNDVVGRAPRETPLPLSAGQRRLWFLNQLDPDSTQYITPVMVPLPDAGDSDALQEALSHIVAVHEILRTTYASSGESPVQVVREPFRVPVKVVELPGEEDHKRELARHVLRQVGKPFDLRAGPVLRCSLARIPGATATAILTLHHIACDARSAQMLREQLQDCYQRVRTGQALAAPGSGLQYSDYASWQNQRVRAPEVTRQLTYWRQTLAGAKPAELRCDWPRPQRWTGRGAVRAFQVPAAVTSQVLAIGRTRGATPFMTLLAAFAVLLARHTGSADIVVGTPVDGRVRPEFDSLLGFFVNTLALRIDVPGDAGFGEIVDCARTRVRQAIANQEVPIDDLVEQLRAERDPGRNPLFQIMFDMAADEPALLLAEPAWNTAKFDLTFTVSLQEDGGLAGIVEYATDLFSEATADGLARRYAKLLESISVAPAAQVDTLQMIPTAEYGDLLRAGQGALGPGIEECLHTAITRQASLYPDRPAVDAGDVVLTYRALDARSAGLARELRRIGISPEKPVAVCLGRTAEIAVALLGVMKSGGVFVPLEPATPDDRLNGILDNLGAAVVVTEESLAGRFMGRPVLLVEQVPALAVPEEAGEAPDPAGDGAGLGSLAYMIYTSGTTGQPKGVMIDHRAYSSHCQVIAEAYAIRPDDRMAVLASFAFDAALEHIGATLLTGATVVVGDPCEWNAARLPDKLAEKQVTLIDVSPGYYRAMMDGVTADDPRLRRLRMVGLGGDVILAEDARRWASTGLPAAFCCTYGPTEATVTCFMHRVGAQETGARLGHAVLPLGRPVKGTRSYVLDQYLALVPPGVPGELCLGGDRLARGYLNDPAMTAQRFMPDPYGPPGSRLYRTGDLCARAADETVDFLGRLDEQVKIRGFRVELGDIEAALLAHRDVSAATVAAQGKREERSLAAYVVPRSGASLTIDQLLSFLSGRLPDYMLPARWCVLDELPLNANGKVDRKELEKVPLLAPRRGYVKPAGPVAERLAEIWSELLDVAPIGADDDFFQLGGHSLLVARLQIRIQEAFGVSAGLQDLFALRTIAKMAGFVEAAVEADVQRLSAREILELLRPARADEED